MLVNQIIKQLIALLMILNSLLLIHVWSRLIIKHLSMLQLHRRLDTLLWPSHHGLTTICLFKNWPTKLVYRPGSLGDQKGNIHTKLTRETLIMMTQIAHLNIVRSRWWFYAAKNDGDIVLLLMVTQWLYCNSCLQSADHHHPGIEESDKYQSKNRLRINKNGRVKQVCKHG